MGLFFGHDRIRQFGFRQSWTFAFDSFFDFFRRRQRRGWFFRRLFFSRRWRSFGRIGEARSS